MSQRRPYILIYNESNDSSIILEKFREINPYSNFSEYYSADKVLEFFNLNSLVLPDLIIFNLDNFSPQSRQLLQNLKSNSDIRHIPLIILSFSNSENDVVDAYDHYANSYILKSNENQDMHNIVNSIANFWLSIVRFPSND